MDEEQRVESTSQALQSQTQSQNVPTQTVEVPTTGPKAISADEVKKESINRIEKDKKTIKKEKKEIKKSLKKPKKKQKSNFINFLLILAIFLLSTIIIAPPTLRKLMPKKVIVEKGENDQNIILSCTALNINEQYKINSRTKYVNGITKQNIITYNKLTFEELAKEISHTPSTTVNPTIELEFFKKVNGINIKNNQSNTVVSIYDYTVKRNTSNFRFVAYFQELESQKTFYTSQGFSCTEIKD